MAQISPCHHLRLQNYLGFDEAASLAEVLGLGATTVGTAKLGLGLEFVDEVHVLILM